MLFSVGRAAHSLVKLGKAVKLEVGGKAIVIRQTIWPKLSFFGGFSPINVCEKVR
ncbi:hypothetical protein [Legionella gresilensis]|uniref:hypothetical protein n=1 Tax=Legionella gresilensis TaxID=91823 RepID=UPI0013EF876D|nr:hypothetical protein [Legionella gresilensis]